MVDLQNYRGRRVVVVEESQGTTVADTEILEHDRANQVIIISRGALQANVSDRVSVLVFGAGSLLEFKGTLRRTDVSPGRVGIGLYGGMVVDNRQAARYVVNAPAVIEGNYVAGHLIPLNEPVKVVVVNLSTQGCLLRGPKKHFALREAFSLRMLAGTIPPLKATPVRIDPIDNTQADCGCRLEKP